MNRSQAAFPESNSKLILQNDAAIFPWLMATCFCVAVVIMTWLILRDGLPTNLNRSFAIGMVAFFWTAQAPASLTAITPARVWYQSQPRS